MKRLARPQKIRSAVCAALLVTLLAPIASADQPYDDRTIYEFETGGFCVAGWPVDVMPPPAEWIQTWFGEGGSGFGIIEYSPGDELGMWNFQGTCGVLEFIMDCLDGREGGMPHECFP